MASYRVPDKDFAGTSFWLPLKKGPTLERPLCSVRLPTGRECSVPLQVWESVAWRSRAKPVPARLLLLTEVLMEEPADDPMDLCGGGDDNGGTALACYLAQEPEQHDQSTTSLPWEDFERQVWTYVQLLVEMALHEQAASPAAAPTLRADRFLDVYRNVMEPAARAVLVRFFLIAVAAPAMLRQVELRQEASGNDTTQAFCHVLTSSAAADDPLLAHWFRLERALVERTLPKMSFDSSRTDALTLSERLVHGLLHVTLPIQKQPNHDDGTARNLAYRHAQALRSRTVRAAWWLLETKTMAKNLPGDIGRYLELGAEVSRILQATVCAERTIDFFEKRLGFHEEAYKRPALADASAVTRERDQRREEIQKRARANASGEWVPPRDRQERRERAADVGATLLRGGDMEDIFKSTTKLAPCMAGVLERAHRVGHLRDPERQAVSRWLVNLAPDRSPVELTRVVFSPTNTLVTPDRRRELESGLGYAKRVYRQGKSALPLCGYIIGQTLEQERSRTQHDPPGPRCPFVASRSLRRAGTTVEEHCQGACSEVVGFAVRNPIDPLLFSAKV